MVDGLSYVGMQWTCAVCARPVELGMPIAGAVSGDDETVFVLCRDCGRMHARAGTIGLLKAVIYRLRMLGFSIEVRLDGETF